MLPKIGPMHGVQPVAKANPKRNDMGYLAFVLFGRNFFSKLRFLSLVDNSMNNPNAIIIIPPTWFNPVRILPAVLDKTLLRITPTTEKTTENPKTKKIVLSKMLIRLDIILIVPLFL